jgi:type IV pilus assembly protein PilO
MFYEEVALAHQSAKDALAKADAELTRVQKQQEDFLEREKQHAEVEAALAKKMEVLPMSAATVDNLMQTFQQQARLVGLTVESWTPEAERREEYYARLPVKVRATGTWPQAGEFFRRVAELDRIVNVSNLTLKLSGARRNADPSVHPVLEMDFRAATFRFLTEGERKASPADGKQSKKTRRASKKGNQP